MLYKLGNIFLVEIAICLSCLVCIGLVAAGSGKAPQISKTPHEELIEELGKITPDTSKDVPAEVMRLLAKTVNKNTQKVILYKYSVNELKDLYHVTKDTKYTWKEYERREEMCEQLKSIWSLHEYCLNSLGTYVENFMLHVDKDYQAKLSGNLGFRQRKRIERFHSKVVGMTKNGDDLETAIKKYRSDTKPEDLKQVLHDCYDFLVIIGKKSEYGRLNVDNKSLDKLKGEWVARKRTCQQLITMTVNVAEDAGVQADEHSEEIDETLQ